MHPEPAPEDPGRDGDPASGVPEPAGSEAVPWEPVVTRPDPMTEEEQQALLDAVTASHPARSAAARSNAARSASAPLSRFQLRPRCVYS